MKGKNNCPKPQLLPQSLQGWRQSPKLFNSKIRQCFLTLFFFFNLNLHILWWFRANKFHLLISHSSSPSLSISVTIVLHQILLYFTWIILKVSLLAFLTDFMRKQDKQTLHFFYRNRFWQESVSESTDRAQQILLTWGEWGKRPEYFQPWVGLLESFPVPDWEQCSTQVSAVWEISFSPSNFNVLALTTYPCFYESRVMN